MLTYLEQIKIINKLHTEKVSDMPVTALAKQAAIGIASDFLDSYRDVQIEEIPDPNDETLTITVNQKAVSYLSKMKNICQRLINVEQPQNKSLISTFISVAVSILGKEDVTLAQLDQADYSFIDQFLSDPAVKTAILERLAGILKEEKTEYEAA